MTTKLTNLIRKFHNDEEGLEALQVVMIIAIAAMVMIACATLGQSAVTWMQGKWSTLQGTNITADGSGAAGGRRRCEWHGWLTRRSRWWWQVISQRTP